MQPTIVDNLVLFHGLFLAHLSIFRLHVARDLKTLINFIVLINATQAAKGRTDNLHIVIK